MQAGTRPLASPCSPLRQRRGRRGGEGEEAGRGRMHRGGQRQGCSATLFPAAAPVRPALSLPPTGSSSVRGRRRSFAHKQSCICLLTLPPPPAGGSCCSPLSADWRLCTRAQGNTAILTYDFVHRTHYGEKTRDSPWLFAQRHSIFSRCASDSSGLAGSFSGARLPIPAGD